MRVAVVGTGINGNAAAWILSNQYPVTVYDRERRLGGHGHTVGIDYDNARLSVDIGYIVYNELNYPDLTDAPRLTFNQQSVEGARLAPRPGVARNTGLAIGKINDYTSSALSTRAKIEAGSIDLAEPG